MPQQKKEITQEVFQNRPEQFQEFLGTCISTSTALEYDFTNKNVAIVGINQQSVSILHHICQTAQSVKVFQFEPCFILPATQHRLYRFISRPLLIKSKQTFSNRIKSLIALRFLDQQIHDTWLKRQLTPNIAAKHKFFFTSDNYYSALQQPNCQLITWPIVKVSNHGIVTMDCIEHSIDILITTFSNST